MKTHIEDFQRLKEVVMRERTTYLELNSLEKYMQGAEPEEKKMIASQIFLIKQALIRLNEQIPSLIDKINIIRPLNPVKKVEEDKKEVPKQPESLLYRPSDTNTFTSDGKSKVYTLKELRPTSLEKLTLKRMKKREEKHEVVKEKKPSEYIKIANKYFAHTSEKIINEKTFKELETDLRQANMQFTPRSYISVIFLTSLIMLAVGILSGIFFFFFKISPDMPILFKATGSIGKRLLVAAGIAIASPIITFIIMYSYPGLEKSSTATRIEDELPFATIHMSAISGSMIDPSQIFNIIISTGEYPFIEKEFKKLINEINLYGYDLVSALRNGAYNNPSRKLSELFNGLATTINSGGDLPQFFDKRSQTLLFENKLEQEKKTKAAETFMDIYISLVVAAPMILMILLMMMKISGLGISMSTQMITIIMVIAVTMINIVFLTFLQLKK
jgi:hypothetical protein